MKKLFVILVLLILSGCAAQTDAEPYDIRKEMSDMSEYIESKEVFDVDVAAISDFFASFNNTDYRLRGMVTEYEEYKDMFGNNQVKCEIVCGNRPVSVFLDGGELTSNGEYIEVVGKLLSISNSDWGENVSQYPANIAISFAHIVERGASVREQIEDSQND